VVAKHRRSEPSLAPVGAPVIAELWPEVVPFGRAGAMAGPVAVYPMAGPAGDRYPARDDYDGRAADPAWADASEEQSWREWQRWQACAPPPELHPDHPSAPMPRVHFPPDHPSGPMSAIRRPGAPERPRPRQGRPAAAWSAPPQAPNAGYQNRPVYAVPDHAPVRREATGNQPRRGTDPRPAIGHFQDSSLPSREPDWRPGQVLTLSDGRSARIAQEAQDYAAAIREAAERDAAAITEQAACRADEITRQATAQAAAIREALKGEAAELQARLDSMSGELSRVAAYVTENLAAPPMPATAPALPAAMPALPDVRPSRPDTSRPTGPDAKPTGPNTTRRAGPTARPAAPSVRPVSKPAGRQAKAMRKMMATFAAVSVFGAAAGTTELVLHGIPFFLFRANGAGATETGPTEPANPPHAGQPFLPGAQHKAAAQHPSGKHHKPTTTSK
jgi:hypothetical protein